MAEQTIYIVTEVYTDYEHSTTSLLGAFFDKAKADAMANEYNKRSTLESVIEKMVDEFRHSLEKGFAPPVFCQERRPIFDQERSRDPVYLRAYKDELTERKKARKAFERGPLRAYHEEYSRSRLAEVNAYRASLSRNEIAKTHETRNHRTWRYVEPVQLVF